MQSHHEGVTALFWRRGRRIRLRRKFIALPLTSKLDALCGSKPNPAPCGAGHESSPDAQFCLRVISKKDTKLKADELRQKRMTFCPSGFNLKDKIIY